MKSTRHGVIIAAHGTGADLATLHYPITPAEALSALMCWFPDHEAPAAEALAHLIAAGWTGDDAYLAVSVERIPA